MSRVLDLLKWNIDDRSLNNVDLKTVVGGKEQLGVSPRDMAIQYINKPLNLSDVNGHVTIVFPVGDKVVEATYNKDLLTDGLHVLGAISTFYNTPIGQEHVLAYASQSADYLLSLIRSGRTLTVLNLIGENIGFAGLPIMTSGKYVLKLSKRYSATEELSPEMKQLLR